MTYAFLRAPTRNANLRWLVLPICAALAIYAGMWLRVAAPAVACQLAPAVGVMLGYLLAGRSKPSRPAPAPKPIVVPQVAPVGPAPISSKREDERRTVAVFVAPTTLRDDDIKAAVARIAEQPASFRALADFAVPQLRSLFAATESDLPPATAFALGYLLAKHAEPDGLGAPELSAGREDIKAETAPLSSKSGFEDMPEEPMQEERVPCGAAASLEPMANRNDHTEFALARVSEDLASFGAFADFAIRQLHSVISAAKPQSNRFRRASPARIGAFRLSLASCVNPKARSRAR